MNELDLVDRFINFIELLERRNHSTIELSKEISLKMHKYKLFRDQVLEQQNITTENKPLKFHEYFKHIVINGSDTEKAELLSCIKQPLYIHSGEILSNPLI